MSRLIENSVLKTEKLNKQSEYKDLKQQIKDKYGLDLDVIVSEICDIDVISSITQERNLVKYEGTQNVLFTHGVQLLLDYQNISEMTQLANPIENVTIIDIIDDLYSSGEGNNTTYFATNPVRQLLLKKLLNAADLGDLKAFQIALDYNLKFKWYFLPYNSAVPILLDNDNPSSAFHNNFTVMKNGNLMLNTITKDMRGSYFFTIHRGIEHVYSSPFINLKIATKWHGITRNRSIVVANIALLALLILDLFNYYINLNDSGWFNLNSVTIIGFIIAINSFYFST